MTQSGSLYLYQCEVLKRPQSSKPTAFVEPGHPSWAGIGVMRVVNLVRDQTMDVE